MPNALGTVHFFIPLPSTSITLLGSIKRKKKKKKHIYKFAPYLYLQKKTLINKLALVYIQFFLKYHFFKYKLSKISERK